MMEHAGELLVAERRGRALALSCNPSYGDYWSVDVSSDANGSALMVAARWAARMGAIVEVHLPDGESVSNVWETLAESSRLQDLVKPGEPGPTGRLDITNANGVQRVKDIPDAKTAWSIDLAESRSFVFEVDKRSLLMTCEECRQIDRRAVIEFGVPGLCLMENAAVAAVTVARTFLKDDNDGVVIVAGGGNNGGDGLAMARGLSTLGIRCEVVLMKPADSLAGDARDNYDLFRGLPNAVLHEIPDKPDNLTPILVRNNLVVDGLLGTGYSGSLAPEYRRAIEIVNLGGKPILALDLPSGLNGDSGKARELAVRATACVTFGGVKVGLTVADGPAYSGRLYMGDIGAPNAAYS